MEDYEVSDDDNYNCDYYEEVDDQSDSDDLRNYGFESFDSSSSSASKSIKVITKESLLSAQSEDLRKVIEVLSVKEHHARALLVHYRWDVQKVLSVLVERGKERLFAIAGLTVLESEDTNDDVPDLPSVTLCNICMEDVPAIEVTTMDCGHFFCNSCWTQHFTVNINEGQSRRIKCMAYKCNDVCDEAKVRVLVGGSDPTLVKKFDRFLLESYIEDNEKVKWCPSVPHCGNAIRSTGDDLCEVECSCGLAFCFGCLLEPHSPCSCQMWELWENKCRNESETINWITVNAKPCPKCHKLVEKNGGCNLVRCICKQPFCWLCGEATGLAHNYESIDGHSCGRYSGGTKIQKEKAKKYLLRYMHYYNRFKAHRDSLMLESKLKENIKERISTLEERDTLSRDFSWLTNGLYRLFRSRRILSYTYPFAYYMFGEFGEELNEKENAIKQYLFEDQQQRLETLVESLSSCLEIPFEEYSDDKIMETRMEIINLTVLVDNRCRQLYECIENDMLGSLRLLSSIASYNSNGVDKASELGASMNTTQCV